MRARDAFKLSTRMFKTNPARTWLTILGMGVGTSAVVMLVGLGFGLQNILLEKIVFGDTLLSLTVTNPPSNAVVLTDATLASFKAMPNVIDVSPLADLSSVVTFNGLSANTDLEGVKASYFKYAGIAMAAGQSFTDDPGRRQRHRSLERRIATFRRDRSEPDIGKAGVLQRGRSVGRIGDGRRRRGSAERDLHGGRRVERYGGHLCDDPACNAFFTGWHHLVQQGAGPRFGEQLF